MALGQRQESGPRHTQRGPGALCSPLGTEEGARVTPRPSLPRFLGGSLQIPRHLSVTGVCAICRGPFGPRLVAGANEAAQDRADAAERPATRRRLGL